MANITEEVEVPIQDWVEICPAGSQALASLPLKTAPTTVLYIRYAATKPSALITSGHVHNHSVELPNLIVGSTNAEKVWARSGASSALSLSRTIL